jgi:hypothetical protein
MPAKRCPRDDTDTTRALPALRSLDMLNS